MKALTLVVKFEMTSGVPGAPGPYQTAFFGATSETRYTEQVLPILKI